MDIRNVQKTGNMFYLYLPTSWVRKHCIGPGSKVSVSTSSDGTLSVHPEITPKSPRQLHLQLDEDDQDILNKLIVSCYISPVSSFKISLKKDMDSARLLDQKKLLNVELVEFDGRNISCESTISVTDPLSLLKTMVTKVKNLISIMLSHYNEELIERYEEEIDRSKLLIEKATISLLSYHESTTLRSLDLHFISILAQSLERLTDHLRQINSSEKGFLTAMMGVVETLRTILDRIFEKKDLSVHDLIPVVRTVHKTKGSLPSPMSEQKHHQLIVLSSMELILEVLMDWTVINSLEK